MTSPPPRKPNRKPPNNPPNNGNLKQWEQNWINYRLYRNWQLRHMKELMPLSAQQGLARALSRVRNVRYPPGRSLLRAHMNLQAIENERKKVRNQIMSLLQYKSYYNKWGRGERATSKKRTREDILYEKIASKIKKLKNRNSILFQMKLKLSRFKFGPSGPGGPSMGGPSMNYINQENLKKIMRENALARHLEWAVRSPHFRIGRTLLRKEATRNINLNELAALAPKKRNNFNSNEAYHNYLRKGKWRAAS